jgi:hypothetical protein
MLYCQDDLPSQRIITALSSLTMASLYFFLRQRYQDFCKKIVDCMFLNMKVGFVQLTTMCNLLRSSLIVVS